MEDLVHFGANSYRCLKFCYFLRLFHQANATGRSAKTVREFLEKHWTVDDVATEKGTVKLAIKALLEVVQSGRKNLEIAVMRRGQPMQVRNLFIRPSNNKHHAHLI